MRDFEQFARHIRLQFIFHWENSDFHPFHVKSDWIPPIQPSVTLESEKRLKSQCHPKCFARLCFCFEVWLAHLPDVSEIIPFRTGISAS